MGASARYDSKKQKMTITVEFNLPEEASMLDAERQLQEHLNEGGSLASGEILSRFDTDGSPIRIGNTVLTSKGKKEKTYQTPYGPAVTMRHVYQSSEGGKTFCPLENQARIIQNATPYFAKMLSSKMLNSKSTVVVRDMLENHSRKTSKCYMQNVVSQVGKIYDQKETTWTYHEQVPYGEVSTIAVSVDGTCMYVCEEGFRLAMVGTISLYDEDGERLHTSYIGQTPEYGKEAFYEKMRREMGRYKVEYSHAKWVGLADGAKDNWSFLNPYIQVEILDFFHAAGYVEKLSEGFGISESEVKLWQETTIHELQTQEGKVDELLHEIAQHLAGKLSKKRRKSLEAVQSYYQNNRQRMDYVAYQDYQLPIGSGVVEAAAKTLIKERMCGTGMKWKCPSAKTIINLRSLYLTDGRWTDFWAKVSNQGFFA